MNSLTERKSAGENPRTQIKALSKWSPSYLYRGLLFNAFEKMKRGRLKIYLPNEATIEFGGSIPGIGASIHVRNNDFFRKCVLSGDIGFGESFVDGDWDSPQLEDVVSWFIANIEDSPGISGSKAGRTGVNWTAFVNRALHWLRKNSHRGSRKNIHAHYDLGNEFFAQFLDPTMTYSSAYFQTPEQTLEEAQNAKYDALCEKLRIRPGEHVLEIGCGWGGFALHAAKKYGCKVTGITLSQEQYVYAARKIREAGLERLVDIRLTDYREVEGNYDKIVSIEMLEAVGDKYMERFFSKCDQVLKKDGLLAIQFITCPDSRFGSMRTNVDWIQKHIFPGSLLMSVGRVNQALNKTSELFLHHLEDLGRSYVETLHRWHETFKANLANIRHLGYDERFIRAWTYYLLYSKAAFKMRNISVVQAVYTRPNNKLLISEAL